MTVRDVSEGCKGKFIILFLRDGDSTSMHKIESVNNYFGNDILSRTVLRKHIFVFKNMFHIELSI